MYQKKKNLQKQGLVCLMNEQISVWYIFKVKTNHENMQECSQYCKVYLLEILHFRNMQSLMQLDFKC